MIDVTGFLGSRIIRFCLTGALAAATHIAVFTVAIEMLEVSAALASVPSFLLALLVSYTGHYRWTFQSSGSHRAQLPKYAVVAATGLVLNILIAYTVVDILGAWYGAALFLSITAVPVVTFLLSGRWVFNG